MALFPEYDQIGFLPGIGITIEYNTSISTLSGGQEKRRSKFTFPLYDVNISYDLLTLANARILWQFYKDRKGAYGSFYFYLPYLETFEGEYCGTGDGTTTAFDVPGKTITSYTIYDGGSEQTEGVDYNISSVGGVERAAQINFVVAPVSGNHISVDFRGYYRFKLRFEEDKLSFNVFAQKLIKMGISLVGVR
jgi:hypothetical protein